MENVKRTVKVPVLGREIGWCTGWAHVAHNEIVFYNFRPGQDWYMNDEFWRQKEKFPKGYDLNFNEEQGLFKIYDDKGDLQDHWDAAKFVSGYKNINIV